MYIKNIPLFDSSVNAKTFSEKNILLYTKININDIEKKINTILDIHNDKIKYYIHCNDSLYELSFNIGMNQYDMMVETGVTLYIYKNNFDEAVIILNKKIDEHPEWLNVKNDIINKLSRK